MNKMKNFSNNIIICSLILLIAMCVYLSGEAKASIESPDQTKRKTTIVELHACEDKKLEVSFFCNDDWELETDKDAILIIIEDDPTVTLTIARSEAPVVFLEQLNNRVLKEMGQYADGFSTQMVQIDEKDAILVEGSAENYPNVRLKDYYLIHNFKLYSILFSVNPKDRWSEYSNLIDRIIESLHFLS